MKISIIVPVYNNDLYLSQCIDSIIRQDYDNIELILVNDGSTDNSGAICDKYQAKDNRVKVFHIKNSGVSTARNIGLKNATGDYISFVDSDDWIDEGMYSYIINKITKGVDLIYFSKNDSDLYIENKIYTKKDIRNHFLTPFIGYSSGKTSRMATVWSMLISKTLIYNIKFEEISIAEDKIFFLEILLRANNLLTLKSYYNYRDNPNSTLNTYNTNYVTDMTICNKKVQETLERYNMYTSKIRIYHNNTILIYFYGVLKNEVKNIINNGKNNKADIEKYYKHNNVGNLLTWSKTLNLSFRNPKWILIKLKKYDLIIKILYNRNKN